MAIILSLETATLVCSVAIHEDGYLLAYAESLVARSHAERITLLIEEVLQMTALDFTSLDAIAISAGPGSYTGLRIASSTAKGLCFALDIPLIAVNTLQAIAVQVQLPDYNICPMLDARRMEVYCAIYDPTGKQIRPVEAKIIDEYSFSEYQNLVFCGDGAAKCKTILQVKGSVFIDHVFPTAIQIGKIATMLFIKKQFVDTVYFEPYYLKEFVALKSSKVMV